MSNQLGDQRVTVNGRKTQPLSGGLAVMVGSIDITRDLEHPQLQGVVIKQGNYDISVSTRHLMSEAGFFGMNATSDIVEVGVMAEIKGKPRIVKFSVEHLCEALGNDAVVHEVGDASLVLSRDQAATHLGHQVLDKSEVNMVIDQSGRVPRTVGMDAKLVRDYEQEIAAAWDQGQPYADIGDGVIVVPTSPLEESSVFSHSSNHSADRFNIARAYQVQTGSELKRVIVQDVESVFGYKGRVEGSDIAGAAQLKIAAMVGLQQGYMPMGENVPASQMAVVQSAIDNDQLDGYYQESEMHSQVLKLVGEDQVYASDWVSNIKQKSAPQQTKAIDLDSKGLDI